MPLDPRTLGAAYVLLSALLGALLFFAWTHNRKVGALAWWGTAFCLVPIGVGMANLGRGAPGAAVLLIANALVALAYGVLYSGCRVFNARKGKLPAVVAGLGVWIVAFPFIHERPSARLLLLSLIVGGYAALSGWELWKHAPRRLASQRAAVILLLGLAAFNFFRGMLGLSLSSVFWIDAFASRWSAEMALLLVFYAPTLAFIFLSMAKERIEADYKRTEHALRESEEHYRHSVELNPQIPWTADLQGNIINSSSRWHNLTGMAPGEGLGSGWMKVLHPNDFAPTRQRWLQSLSSGEPLDTEYRVRLVDGSYRWFRARAAARRSGSGAILRWYGTLEDVHESRLTEERLRWAAYHDDLTGLPNRRLFQERLQQALDEAAKVQRRVGLLIMDLDDFKQINDRFGHDAGDELLRAFGKRLAGLVRPGDTVARLGGDEFAVILSDTAGEDDVAVTARVVQTQMQKPLRLINGMRECRTSIGCAASPVHGANAEELLKQADLALYSCKSAGRGSFTIFRPDMREEAQKMTSALEVARNALASDWIVPFYQPKVALGSGALVGFEALLRWQHPRTGIQSPDTISPAFDDLELGRAIGERMLSRVISDMRGWLDSGSNPGRIAINVSAAEFHRDDYAKRVLDLLHRADVPPSCIEVEVTESVFLDRNAGNIEQALRALRAAGVTIALDDFGTGYASLTHLKRFPVNVIKIDRSFVSDMESDADDAAIIKAVLSLSHNLGIEVVAEGIETLAQATLLRAQDCELGQGYFFGAPMAAGSVPQFIRSWGCAGCSTQEFK